jgi:hypothetical protein
VWQPALAEEPEDSMPDPGQKQDTIGTSRALALHANSDAEPDQSGLATRITLRPHDPGTGNEVEKEEVVKGYEYQRGQFVTFTPEGTRPLWSCHRA